MQLCLGTPTDPLPDFLEEGAVLIVVNYYRSYCTHAIKRFIDQRNFGNYTSGWCKHFLKHFLNKPRQSQNRISGLIKESSR